MTERDGSVERAALDLVEWALAEPEEDRRDYIAQSKTSEAVRTRAAAILTAQETPQSFIATGGVAHYSDLLAEPPETIGAYRIIKEIGRGGMGTVYLAQRVAGDFDHQVAVKVVATGKLSDKLIERFERERQTLAALNHPHIARLYDGGETDDNLPYLVMEYVPGQPLDAWLETGASQENRFAILAQILAAVEHAHSNLVIHRDLTPSNVIVSNNNDVKLIDFGISSFQAQDDGNLITGQTATPGFAAPEAGHTKLQSTSLDIFAIGKLIQILFKADDQPELDAIASKAAAIDAKERYSTVRELAEDVDRFRSGHAVAAVNGGLGYNMRKYVVRNWLPVGAAAAIALTLGVSIGLLAQAYTQEQAARQLANQRFEDVRALASTMMFDVYDAVDAIPNTVEARQLVARSSIEYLNSLAITPDAPPDLRREVGEGWLRLSQVTGGSSGDNIGLPEDALTFGARALDILEALHRDVPNDLEAQVALGRAYSILGLDSLYAYGDSKTGFERAQRAVDLLSPIAPSTERIAAATARAYRALGDAYGWQNDLPQAGVAYSDGRAFVRSLTQALQSSLAVRLEMATLMRQGAEVYRFTGKPDQAMEQMRDTVQFNQDTFDAASQADDNSARRALVISLWNIADMSAQRGAWEEGLRHAIHGSTLVQQAMANNPSDVGWYDMYAQINTPLAMLYSGKGAHDDALAAADATLTTARQIRAKSGANAGTDLALAVHLRELAPVYKNAGQADIACASLAEAIAILTAYENAGDLSTYDRENNLMPAQQAAKEC